MYTWSPEYKQWLSSLKVGDTWQCIIPSRWGLGEIVTKTIDGETPKRWKVDDGEQYNKDDGRIVGKGYNKLLPPATDEELSKLRGQIKHERLSRALEQVKWRDQSVETLTEIVAIINSSKQE